MQQPAAVERSTGEEVESGDNDVDDGEPHQRCDRQRRESESVHRESKGTGCQTYRKTGRRPDSCDPGFGAGIGRLTLELGYAAEQPQHDTGDADAVPPGNERVGKLVDEDACNQAGGREGACQPVGTVAVAVCLGRQHDRCQRPRQQPDDHEDAPADANLDTGDAAQRPALHDALLHLFQI